MKCPIIISLLFYQTEHVILLDSIIMKSNKEPLYIRNCIFGFQCKENWSEMAYISNADSGSEIRFCSSCEKEVYECTSDQELTDNVRINRCVVIARSTDTDDILLGMIKPQVFKLRD